MTEQELQEQATQKYLQRLAFWDFSACVEIAGMVRMAKAKLVKKNDE